MMKIAPVTAPATAARIMTSRRSASPIRGFWEIRSFIRYLTSPLAVVISPVTPNNAISIRLTSAPTVIAPMRTANARPKFGIPPNPYSTFKLSDTIR